jgi:hypothetical protein
MTKVAVIKSPRDRTTACIGAVGRNFFAIAAIRAKQAAETIIKMRPKRSPGPARLLRERGSHVGEAREQERFRVAEQFQAGASVRP